MRIQTNEIQKLLRSFSSLAGFGSIYLDSEFHSVCECSSCGLMCPLATVRSHQKTVNQPEIHMLDERKFTDCREIHSRAAFQAERFGGQYIYFCMAGLMFCIIPLVSQPVTHTESSSLAGYLLAGPIMATEREEFTPEYLSRPETADKMAVFLDTLCYISSEKINDALNILKVIAEHIGGVDDTMQCQKDKLFQQQEIGNYIQGIKTKLMSAADDFIPYPYERGASPSHKDRE